MHVRHNVTWGDDSSQQASKQIQIRIEMAL